MAKKTKVAPAKLEPKKEDAPTGETKSDKFKRYLISVWGERKGVERFEAGMKW